MKKSMKISKLQLFVVLSLFLVLATSVFSVSAKDKVVSGSDFNLQSGETLDGNLVVFGGNVTVYQDALVDGDVAVFGGNIVIDGMIDGDFVALGGSIKLGANAVIDGDFSSLGGSVDKSPTAVITGDTMRQSVKIISNIDLFGDDSLMNPNDNSIRSGSRGFFRAFFGTIASIVVFFAMILIIAGLGLLVSLLFDNHLKGISRTLIEQPLSALGIGLLAIIASIAMIIFMSITVIFIPVAIILAVALGLLMFYGWIACGYETGLRLTKAMNVNWSDMWVTAFGTFVITLVSMGFNRLIPCVGWILGTALTLVGLGGVIISYYRRIRHSSGSNGTPLFPKNSDIPRGDYSPKEGTIQQSSKEVLKDSNGETAADSDHAGQEIVPTVVEMPAKSDSTRQQEIPITTDEIIPESTPLETHDSETESTAGEVQIPEDSDGKTSEQNGKGFGASILDSIKSDLEDDEKKPE